MIAVFGASVTQQKDGYAVRLGDKLNHPVKIFGYGGMHLSNAAICFIDEVVEKNPVSCFVDWFSTGYNTADDNTVQYIDTIIYKFSIIQCKLIFLFLPYKNDPVKKEFYSFCKSVLRSRGISFIDVDSEIEKSKLDAILRDGIHTTEYGSDLYSEIICKKYEEIKNCIKIQTGVSTTKYFHIKHIPVNRMFDSNIKLFGNCEIIGFLLTIGPHSGMIEVNNGKELQTYNTWDRWCYYPRRHFNLPLEIKGDVQINILQRAFDTVGYNGQIDFNRKKKKLIVHAIYYVGEYLDIRNIHEGFRINNMSISMRKVLGRVDQYKNKLFRNR